MRVLSTLIVGIALVGCSLASAEPKPFTLDLGHAYVGWEIDHFGYSDTVGQFNTFDGVFLIDENAPENSQISFVIQAASIDSNHPGRDNHLRAPDFLNVEDFPTIEFVSTGIAMTDDTNGVITGDLTCMGITKPFSMTFTKTADAPFAEFLPRYDQLRAVGFEAEGRFDRLAHGFDVLNFPGTPIGQYITLDIHFDLVDCENAPANNIPCNYGRDDTMEFPYE